MAGIYWDTKALALATGTLWGLYLFLLTISQIIGFDFWWFDSAYFNLMKSAHAGMEATWLGAFIALVEGFICGAVCGFLLGWVYNLFHKGLRKA